MFCLGQWSIPPLGALTWSHNDHLIGKGVAAWKTTKTTFRDCLKLAEKFSVRSESRVLTDVCSGERCAVDRAASPVVTTASGRF